MKIQKNIKKSDNTIGIAKKAGLLVGIFAIMCFLAPTILIITSFSSNDKSASFTIIENPITSDYWVLSDPIIIDALSTNNWEWAESQPWCSGEGTLANPYVIENLTVDLGWMEISCIEIRNSNVHFIVKNCTLTGSKETYPEYETAGLKFSNVTNGQIIDNDVSYNGISILLYDSDNNILLGNKIDHCTFGIFLYSDSDENSILENILDYCNNQGIVLLKNCDINTISNNHLVRTSGQGISVRDHSNNNIISENIIRLSNYDGIFIFNHSNNNIISRNIVSEHKQTGIFLQNNSNQNFISENKIFDNQKIGIKLDYSHENVIEKNLLYNNAQLGIILSYSNENLIYYNSFIKNNRNAEANGIYNYWDTGSYGNYWDDYFGDDGNGDGIGDSPYFIGSDRDRYPLMNQYNHAPYSITNPSPGNGAEIHDYYTTLSVELSDFEDDLMDVSFYNASDDSLIRTDYSVASGGTASVTWTRLSEGTTHSWYAVANDGMASTTSSTWSFTTVAEFYPVADFEMSTNNIYRGETIEFTYTGSEGDGIANYSWDFGDSTPIINKWHPSHQFMVDGTFNVKLRVQDSDGDWSNEVIQVVTVKWNDKPVLSVPEQLTIISGTNWITCTVSDNMVYSSEYAMYIYWIDVFDIWHHNAYYWDPGTPINIYAAKLSLGQHSIRIAFFDGYGLYDMKDITVTVIELPPIDAPLTPGLIVVMLVGVVGFSAFLSWNVKRRKA
ncbi:MAG: right-handed parallel beta-helix repeat-containing protein, partial [Candidatus Lokiarchaeota archaeon]|nr:right-handed parallel beta-helix repeat-containing protein [Candidatus Lokiarchaeota archaeon]